MRSSRHTPRGSRIEHSGGLELHRGGQAKPYRVHSGASPELEEMKIEC